MLDHIVIQGHRSRSSFLRIVEELAKYTFWTFSVLPVVDAALSLVLFVSLYFHRLYLHWHCLRLFLLHLRLLLHLLFHLGFHLVFAVPRGMSPHPV